MTDRFMVHRVISTRWSDKSSRDQLTLGLIKDMISEAEAKGATRHAPFTMDESGDCRITWSTGQ